MFNVEVEFLNKWQILALQSVVIAQKVDHTRGNKEECGQKSLIWWSPQSFGICISIKTVLKRKLILTMKIFEGV